MTDILFRSGVPLVLNIAAGIAASFSCCVCFRKKSRIFYCIYVAKRAPEYVPEPEPEPEPIEIPVVELEEPRDSIISLFQLVSYELPSQSSYAVCYADNYKNDIEDYSYIPKEEKENYSFLQLKTILIYDLSSTINL